MRYLKLMNARSKSAQQPSMKPVVFSAKEKRRTDQGRCIQCGNRNNDRHSYICTECQSKETIEEVREDIQAVRQKILNRSS